MKKFSISPPAEMLIVNVNPRREKHGKDRVPAVDVRCLLTVPNGFLAQLKPELIDALYVAAGPGDEPPQGVIDGVAPISDKALLRVPGLAPVQIADELTGYTVTFDVGTGRKESLVELAGCKLNAFSVEALQGGSVKISFRAQAAGLTEREFGKLCMMIDSHIGVQLDPPLESASIEGAGDADVDFRSEGGRSALKKDMQRHEARGKKPATH